ncbi:GNAT family N-acetyltransferase [Chitinophaga vietnamensis]|uniref:GNAT family N-acetyltransferase n=1 Tax=Chitinophaga vietnamensis TaxID=2593957 RepID=UPI0011785061|nr:GNAT family N-acetyltransferase [Chitinophaga vietnamensis]
MSAVDACILETWVKGWSMAREVPPPEPFGDGFRTEVGWPGIKTRYVFPACTPMVRELAATIDAPHIFLKVCAPVEEVAAILPAAWKLEAPAFMMSCPHGMHPAKHHLLPQYHVDVNKHAAVPLVRILTARGEEAAVGRVALVDGYAIYDRIETHPDHRRRGLGSVIMKTLEAVAKGRGARKGLLVATAQGRELYHSLGWEYIAPYTTAVIPETEI